MKCRVMSAFRCDHVRIFNGCSTWGWVAAQEETAPERSVWRGRGGGESRFGCASEWSTNKTPFNHKPGTLHLPMGPLLC